MITDPGRLQRIKDWDPDVSIVGELRNMVTRGPEHLQARWLAAEARKLSVQSRSPKGQEFYKNAMGAVDPLHMVKSLLKLSK